MKKLLLLSALFLLTFTPESTIAQNLTQSKTKKKSDKSLLFVHTAESAKVTNNNTIIMLLERDVFAFTDRPNREHYWLKGEQYASLWSSNNPNSFKTDPPNAVLTFADGDEVKELEVVITKATYNGANITYSIKDNLGINVSEIKSVSLFVDSLFSDFITLSFKNLLKEITHP